MKTNWKTKKLGDIITPAKVVKNGNNNDFPILSITMHDGIVLQSSRFKKAIASVDTSGYKVVKNGQLVIAFPIDEGLIYTQDIVDVGIMSPAYNIWDVDFSEIDRKFLVLYLHSPFAMAYYKSKLRGTTMRRRSIPKEDLLNMPLPVPPIEIQHSILNELEKIQNLISYKKTIFSDYEQLSMSLFYTMFGDPFVNDKKWQLKKLGDCFSYIKNGANIKQTKGAKGYPITRIETLSGGIFNYDRLGYADIFDLAKYENYILQKDDLLLSHINSKTNIGRTVRFTGEFDGEIIHGMNLLRLKNNPSSINSTFFAYYTLTDKFKVDVARIRKDAVNQSSIAISDIKEFLLPSPPIDLQNQFAEKVHKIELLKNHISIVIKDLETLLSFRKHYWFD